MRETSHFKQNSNYLYRYFCTGQTLPHPLVKSMCQPALILQSGGPRFKRLSNLPQVFLNLGWLPAFWFLGQWAGEPCEKLQKTEWEVAISPPRIPAAPTLSYYLQIFSDLGSGPTPECIMDSCFIRILLLLLLFSNGYIYLWMAKWMTSELWVGRHSHYSNEKGGKEESHGTFGRKLVQSALPAFYE